jgi:tRNA(Ile)-lysidine synthase TilS/MesJ
MQDGVERFANDFSLPLVVKATDKPLRTEAEFREGRFKFIKDSVTDFVVCHTLDDAVESYLDQCIKGHQWKIPIRIISKISESTVYRPFLLIEKTKFREYSKKHGLGKYIVEDESNSDPQSGKRAWIRNIIVPLLNEKKLGPRKVVRKKYLNYLRETKKLEVSV